MLRKLYLDYFTEWVLYELCLEKQDKNQINQIKLMEEKMKMRMLPRSGKVVPAMKLFVLIFLFTITVANATPENKEIIISVGAKGWPPYSILHKDGTAGGLMIDVLRTIASMHGYKVAVKYLPSVRGAIMLEAGEIDSRLKAKEWVDHPEKYIWTDPVVDSTDVLIFHKDNPIVFNTPEDLFGKRIGTVVGYGYPLLKPYFVSGKIIREDAPRNSFMLKKVALKRTDAAIVNKFNAQWMIKNDPELQEGTFSFSKNNIGKAGYRFMFTSKHDWVPFVHFINQELARMKKNRRLEKIIAKYLK